MKKKEGRATAKGRSAVIALEEKCDAMTRRDAISRWSTNTNPASSARSLVEVELNLNPCAPSQYTGADHNLKTIKSPVPKL